MQRATAMIRALAVLIGSSRPKAAIPEKWLPTQTVKSDGKIAEAAYCG